jgi:hypothetical protein
MLFEVMGVPGHIRERERETTERFIFEKGHHLLLWTKHTVINAEFEIHLIRQRLWGGCTLKDY